MKRTRDIALSSAESLQSRSVICNDHVLFVIISGGCAFPILNHNIRLFATPLLYHRNCSFVRENFRKCRIFSDRQRSSQAIPAAVLRSLCWKWLPLFHSNIVSIPAADRISSCFIMQSPTVFISAFFIRSSLSPRLRYTAGTLI